MSKLSPGVEVIPRYKLLQERCHEFFLAEAGGFKPEPPSPYWEVRTKGRRKGPPKQTKKPSPTPRAEQQPRQPRPAPTLSRPLDDQINKRIAKLKAAPKKPPVRKTDAPSKINSHPRQSFPPEFYERRAKDPAAQFPGTMMGTGVGPRPWKDGLG